MIYLLIFGIAVVCFGGSYILFRLFDRQTKPTKKIGFWLLSTISTIGLSLISPYILIFILFSQSATTPREFDSESWKSMEDKRTEMIDDLTEKKLLDNLAKEEVIKLLGEPLTDNPYFIESGRDMIYYLGPERSPVGVDSEWLLIWLTDNKVDRYEVLTD
jgi:hypothetical protein